MSDYKKSYKAKLEVCGPVHIGSGRVLFKNDYIYEKETDKIHVIDDLKIVQCMKKLGLLQEYEAYMYQNPVSGGMTALGEWLLERGVTLEQVKPWILYSMSAQDVTINDDVFMDKNSMNKDSMEIQAFLKDAHGQPYVPGTSLRGVIRTALMARMILHKGADKVEVDKLRQKWNKEFLTLDYKREMEEIEESSEKLGISHLLEENKKNKNQFNDMVDLYMSAIEISDSRPLPIESLILCQKVDMLYDTKPQKNCLGVFRESLKPGTIIEFDFSLNTAILHRKPELAKIFDVTDILAAISESYQNIQAVFVSKFTEINFLNRKNHNKASYLYLGGGTGYNPKTLAYPLLGYLDGVKVVSRILHWSQMNEQGNNASKDPLDAKKSHGHDIEDLVVSPHTLKCTKYHKKLYEIGLCKLSMEE